MRLWENSFKFLTDFKAFEWEFYHPVGKKEIIIFVILILGGKQQKIKVEWSVVTSELPASQCFILQVNIFKILFSGALASFDANEYH